MARLDDISSHIHFMYINEMALLLQDLGSPPTPQMVMSKIICSLPPSYSNIIATWANVPVTQQTVDNLEERVLRHEQLMKIQGGLDDAADQAFFTHTQHFLSGPSLTKKEQHQRDVEYIHDRTKCYSGGTLTIKAPFPMCTSTCG